MPRQSPEYELHKAVVEWLRWTKPDCVWFHPYNGAYMSKATAGKGKALGVLAGVADLVFVYPGELGCGARIGFIELKAPKGALTAGQQGFAKDVEALGARYYVARSIEDVQAALNKWGVTFAHEKGRAA